MKPSVLVTKRIYPEAVDFLRQHADVDDVGTDEGLTAAELIERARGKDAIVSQLTDRLSRDAISQLDPKVRVISNVAVGYDNIDVAAATERGIWITNTPGILSDTTADFAFTLLMAAARRVVEAHEFVHSGKWTRWGIDLLVGQDVHHRTLGIFGMGRIGQAVARRGLGFSMRILYAGNKPVETDFPAEFVSKDTLLRESDYVSLHVPLNAGTRHLIGAAELNMMRKTAILINTARGPVVDEAALAQALKDHVIAGAGLDVFEREPEVNPVLLQLNNVVLAPHIGTASVATRTRMSMMAAENAVAAMEGRRPPNVVNPEAASRTKA
ncbi:MAG TPA: D-glycerate dehydrogenase [Bryobacteraceae bacterium]|jgi:glyoxylate reductase|nr:D-glycerate dehydrogenase [Bryobacteraceae bacterium]